MAKPRQTFWNFEDSPPAPQPVKPREESVSVKEITDRIKKALETGIGSVAVRGEISNLRQQSSGHAYFALKDEFAQIQCVMFRSAASEARKVLADGIKIVARGELSVYEPRGQYQLVVRSIAVSGQGELQLAFERLKQKLREEGLFDNARKRPIPKHPERIGVVTSPTGAAIQDVLHVLRRRHPGLEVILASCRVQGEGAAAEIAGGIHLLNEWSKNQPLGKGLDVVLITRGGGSLEDLWAFNEESVARAVHASVIPVISAVGHEIDFTISDFTADLRAATPSAAAEILSEGAVQANEKLDLLSKNLGRALVVSLEDFAESLEDLRLRLSREHPRRKLELLSQRVDELAPRIKRGIALKLREWAASVEALAARQARSNPRGRLREEGEKLDSLLALLRERGGRGQREKASLLKFWREKLELLAPDRVLSRGYSITTAATTGRVIRNADETSDGDELVTRVRSGQIRSIVKMTATRPLPSKE